MIEIKKPNLYVDVNGNTCAMLEDNVIDSSSSRASVGDDKHRMVLYTNGDELFVMSRTEFFGTDPDTGQRRFTPLPQDGVRIEIDDDCPATQVRMFGANGSLVTAENWKGG
jgi:hypothetical protein